MATPSGTQFQVATDAAFTNKLVDYNGAYKTSHVTTAGVLTKGVPLYSRVRHASVETSYSDWSSTKQFSISNVNNWINISAYNYNSILDAVITNDDSIITVGCTALEMHYVAYPDTSGQTIFPARGNVALLGECSCTGWKDGYSAYSGHAAYMTLSGAYAGFFNKIYYDKATNNYNIIGSDSAPPSTMSTLISYPTFGTVSGSKFTKLAYTNGALTSYKKFTQTTNLDVIPHITIPSGTYVYSRGPRIYKYSSEYGSSMGGKYLNIGSLVGGFCKLVSDSDNNIYAVGYIIKGSITFGIVCKFDMNLNVLWIKYLYDSAAINPIVLQAIDIDLVNNILYIGGDIFVNYNTKKLIIKCDLFGNLIWGRHLNISAGLLSSILVKNESSIYALTTGGDCIGITPQAPPVGAFVGNSSYQWGALTTSTIWGNYSTAYNFIEDSNNPTLSPPVYTNDVITYGWVGGIPTARYRYTY